MPQSNRIYDFSQYEDVTSQFDNKKSFSNNVATLDFGNIDSAYIIKVVSKYTPTSDDELDIAQGASMRTTDKNNYYNYAGYSNFIVTSTDTGGGDGTVKPEEKLYKLVTMYGKTLIKTVFKVQIRKKSQWQTFSYINLPRRYNKISKNRC